MASIGDNSVMTTLKTKTVDHPASSLVSVTAWNYVTTTITLTVASHTLVANDVIEVAGLTTTDTGTTATATYVPNGVWTVTSVTPTTIVYTVSVAPTVTNKSVSSATVKGVTTVNGLYGGLGVGQTMVNVLSFRASGVTYTNTTGKPIMIFLTATSYSASSTFTLNGSMLQLASSNFSILIPNGATYSFNMNGGITYCWELR